VCLFALAEAVVTRNLVRAKRARGEFAKQICASVAGNRGLVLNPTGNNGAAKKLAKGEYAILG
jgi:hypothetical protein